MAIWPKTAQTPSATAATNWGITKPSALSSRLRIVANKATAKMRVECRPLKAVKHQGNSFLRSSYIGCAVYGASFHMKPQCVGGFQNAVDSQSTDPSLNTWKNIMVSPQASLKWLKG